MHAPNGKNLVQENNCLTTIKKLKYTHERSSWRLEISTIEARYLDENIYEKQVDHSK